MGVGYDNSKITAGLWYDTTRISRSLAEGFGKLFAALTMNIASDPHQPIEALESSSDTPSMVFSAEDVARSVYREAASQCELSVSSLEDICPCSLLQQQQIQASIQQRSGRRVDQYVFGIPDHVSKITLSEVLDTVAAASPALRTRFVSLKQGGTCQVTVKATPGWNTETSLSDYLQWDRGFGIRYGGPTCRFGEVNEPDGKAYFVLSLHPAIYDPRTFSLIINAVNEACEDNGQTPTPFQSFGAYIRRLSGRGDAECTEDFWSAQPRWSQEASLQFPCVPHDAPEADLSNSRSLTMQQPPGAKGGVVPTTLTLLPAAWALCLARLSEERKACFGVYVDNRQSNEETDRVTGPVGAVLPCAIDFTALDTGDSLVRAIEEHVKASTPFLRTQNSSDTSISHGIGKDLQPLGNVLVVHDDPASVRQSGRREALKLLETRLSESSFNGARLVTHCRANLDGTLAIEMQYDRNMISAEDIDVLLEQYEHAITQLLSKCSTLLADLDPMSDNERSLLFQWNKHCPGLVKACIHDKIRDIAKQQSAAPAICSWDCDLDHGQLDEFSDRLAALLQQNGVKTGAIIPFFCEKSAATIVVMLGILKAGAAFVALDLCHPAERLATILTDVNASTIVASCALSERVTTKVTAKATILVDMGHLQNLPHVGPQQVDVHPSDTCYINYTSGSTGTPKGAVISHSNLASSMHYSSGPLGMTAATRILQFANFVFDVTILEVFMTLTVGGCICVPHETERMNDISGAIQRTRANWIVLSPSTATLLTPSEVPTLSTLCLGGEPFPKSMIERWKGVRLINCYGPCEVTVMSSHFILSPDSGKHHLNLGRPIPSRYWVVDPNNHNQLVPFGCPGELLVQGPGVAQGYLGDAEQTRKAFIEPPIWATAFELEDLSLQRWYKTGDLVKQMADGSVIFNGRKGTQVKIDGQRVELSEIEHQLERLMNPGWMIAVELIKPREKDIDPYLAMFFADPEIDKFANSETSCQLLPPISQKTSMLRQALASKLPAYMVPQYFIRLDTLPLMSSNKVDRQRLRTLGATLQQEQLSAYSGSADVTDHVKAPENLVNGEQKANAVRNPEAELRKLWSRTLALPASRIKTTDSFFSLGGSSLRAMRLVNNARRTGFSLTVTDVFTRPVFSDLAAAMRLATSGNAGTSSELSTPMPKAPSSSSSASISGSLKSCLAERGFSLENVESAMGARETQADMVAVSKLDGKGFKSVWILEFEAPGLELDFITRACETVIREHVILRTVLVQHEASLQQVVLKTSPKGIAQVNIDEASTEEEAAEDYIGPDTILSDQTPQFRLQVKGTRCHKLRLKIHHALYDAISLLIILQDLHAIYSQQALASGPSYHAWSSHVNSLDKIASRKFWRQRMDGSSMTYLVPPSIEQPTSKGLCCEEISMHVPMITASYGTTASVVQAAWALVLSHITNQRDIVFGCPNANRDPACFPDVDRVPGPCINYLPTRARLDNVSTIGSLIAQIQADAVAAISHQHLGFRDIIRHCTDWPAWTRFSSALLYQNDEAMQILGPSLKFGDLGCNVKAICGIGQAVDLWLQVTPTTSMELMIQMWYSRQTIPEEKAQWIARLLQSALQRMPAAMEQPLERIVENFDEIPVAVATAESSHSSAAALPNGGKSPRSLPSALTQAAVSQIWNEVGLIPAAESRKTDESSLEDKSIFSDAAGAADLVTTMLLSRCYRRKGYKLSMQDLIDHPTHSGQARLLESLE